MNTKKIHDIVTRFFREHNCTILTEHEAYIVVQLTIEMDKKLMNRPYYWQYIESTGETPQLTQLTLITDSQKNTEQVHGEVMHIGAPFLQKIFQVIGEKGSYVQMFEKDTQHTPLTPWFNLNIKVSYCCHQKKDTLYSLGMNLMTGEVLQNFYESIHKRYLLEQREQSTVCLPQVIHVERAYKRLHEIIQTFIHQQPHAWAKQAIVQKEKEQLVLHYFYENMTQKPKRFQLEMEALEALYEPRIELEVVNGGLFYLATYPTFTQHTERTG